MAKRMPETALTSLSHHIDLDWMHEAYRLTRKDGAVGVDGQTAQEFGSDLRANLESLLDRAKSGRYRAPPVRRVHIPKGKGHETRPIGVPAFEDKILQRAVVMALEPIYEHDFLDCSYGFRPDRSAHDALNALWEGLMNMRGGWVLDLDVRSFFDTVDRSKLQQMLRHRVRDGVVLRLVGKWLNAGVLEQGKLSYPEAGTPQGGVLSPLLANVYLHEVLDLWFEHQVKSRMRGQTFLIRYADDAVLCFECEDDARRVMAVIHKRFEKYGLKVHPEKTRLVEFRRPRKGSRPRRSGVGSRRGTFDLLGFTHYWGLSLKGNWVVKRRTAKDRFSRAVSKMTQWCRTARHWPIEEQHQALVLKLRGHYAYYGVTGNGRALSNYRHCVEQIWRKWLDRRSQQRHMSWEKFSRLLERYPLPPPVPIHSVLRRAANP